MSSDDKVELISRLLDAKLEYDQYLSRIEFSESSNIRVILSIERIVNCNPNEWDSIKCEIEEIMDMMRSLT